ncbi:hypothetical protein BDU57DRAFT_347434 [Ampelomyces quisqualis]|uniref:RanBD1 domain-containing protein n=1 Tax=Ampelomyces quisqualis TaxID=50730 RepID=A0A6A5QF93_AMPQU|nr:hypothetical protein BDU57DRAFT_347434 [Ampelomyces quisqualis]
MADSSKLPESAGGTSAATQVKHAAKPAPTSPARSDKSSDSEGKPVRDKLKETRIDAQALPEPAKASDQHMDDAPNGSTKAGEHSASGSDSDRGRIKKKRSLEDFEEDNEGDKHPEKKQEKERHHVRKRSRDVKDIESDAPLKPPAASVTRIDENDGDEQMTTPVKNPSKAVAATSSARNDTSPKNKRTREQAEKDSETSTGTARDSITNGGSPPKAEDERDSKRPRDKEDAQPSASATNTNSKIPPGSGFANFSAASPFAAMSPKPQASKSTDRPELLPQTSDDKFKASGFGSLAKSSSPFGGLASPGSQSPFGAASGSKLGSFAGGTAAPAAPTSGFGALGGTSKTAFGGSTFGSSSGGGFGAIGGTKSALSSFETPSDLTIKGLKSKATAFGTPGHDKHADGSDDEDDSDGDDNDDTKEERQSSQPLLSQQPQETGEEGETTIWTGRTKLYTMVGEGTTKGWKERGVGAFKFNVTVDEPKKARFVLRADGTHRLLLNAAVTKQLVFGGDSNGEKPKDGRLLFNTPNAEGVLEMHLLKLRGESAVQLWEEVSSIQKSEL